MTDTNKTAHTAGPWWVSSVQHGTVYVEARALESRMVQEVAAVGPKEGGSEQRDADARLIAAAPELLETLQLALSAIEQTTSEMTVGDRFTNAGQSLLDALNPCRDAIANATGAPA